MAEKPTAHIYTVSKLTKEIKLLLEDAFPFVWVSGEISNYAVPASGHSYFTLKDDSAVIRSVLFKNQKRNLKFSPENGLKIFGLARITLYEPRGSYQLVFEHLEPAGAGAMQIAFEQLKKKLSEKGFFDDAHKRPVPFLPSKICVITSGTGAALRDIIRVSQRRFPNMPIDIIPVKVQGHQAREQICNALELARTCSDPDLIILARGGGSLEDLQAFNSETLAGAIFQAEIPIITGIGHETDFTIADFTADLRASTPSAAAELAVPDKFELIQKIQSLENRLVAAVKHKLNTAAATLHRLSGRLKTPKLLIYNHQLLLEDFESRLTRSFIQVLEFKKEKQTWLGRSLEAASPLKTIKIYRQRLAYVENRLHRSCEAIFRRAGIKLTGAASRLAALNPENVLNRGYSIARSSPGQRILKDAGNIHLQDRVEIILSKGRFIAKVEQTHG